MSQLFKKVTALTVPILYFQWMVGNVVQREDALYARMKQRDIDAHDSMWEPIFVDDAALGLGDSKTKVLNKKVH